MSGLNRRRKKNDNIDRWERLHSWQQVKSNQSGYNLKQIITVNIIAMSYLKI